MNAWKKAATGLALCLAVSTQALASGAIAVNQEEGASTEDYSFVSMASSGDMASRYARYECRMQGHKSCVVLARFEQCGALAVSDKFFHVGTGATMAQASRKALEHCAGCVIAKAACETPDASQYAQAR